MLFNSRCPSCHSMNRLPFERAREKALCGKCKAPLFDGEPIEGTEENLEPLLKSGVPVVIDFWAPWCNPCVGFAPVFKQVAQERADTVRFIKIDTETQQGLAAKYRIRSIPTIMVLNNGQIVDQVAGALPKTQFDNWLNSALNKKG